MVMETPPPPSAGAPQNNGGDAETLALVAKRARKRSRYLSPPYTDHHSAAEDETGGEENKALLQLQLQLQAANVADMLAALHGAALFHGDAHANVAADVLLRFFALYRASVLAKVDHPPNGDGLQANKTSSSCAVGHRLLNACRAITVAGGSAGKIIKKEDDAAEYAYPDHIGPANAGAATEAGHKRKKVAAAGHNATTDCSLQAANGVANYVPKKKKTRKSTGHAQHYGNPAALVLDFAQDTILPSKEELVSTFREFGFLIESETDIAKDTRRARVVFGTRAEAETAYSCAQTLGTFGPPFATPSLQYLPPIRLKGDSARKLPLTDIRKNLEKMITSLTFSSPFRKDGAKPAVHNLVGEMQGLLAKVDKMLSAGPSTSTAHHR